MMVNANRHWGTQKMMAVVGALGIYGASMTGYRDDRPSKKSSTRGKYVPCAVCGKKTKDETCFTCKSSDPKSE